MKKNIGIFLVMCIMLTAYKNDKFPYDDELDDSEKNEISTEYDSLIDRKIANTKDEKINIGYDEALSEYETRRPDRRTEEEKAGITGVA